MVQASDLATCSLELGPGAAVGIVRVKNQAPGFQVAFVNLELNIAKKRHGNNYRRSWHKIYQNHSKSAMIYLALSIIVRRVGSNQIPERPSSNIASFCSWKNHPAPVGNY